MLCCCGCGAYKECLISEALLAAVYVGWSRFQPEKFLLPFHTQELEEGLDTAVTAVENVMLEAANINSVKIHIANAM